MKLSDLMVDAKSAWIDYPGYEGLEFELVNLSRNELAKIRKDSVYSKFDKKTRQPVELLDEEKFIDLFASKTIKNWKGLKLKYLEDFLTVDISKFPDVDQELPFSQENAKDLLSNSTEFDTWVNENVFDLANFRTGSERPTVESA